MQKQLRPPSDCENMPTFVFEDSPSRLPLGHRPDDYGVKGHKGHGFADSPTTF